MAKIKEDYVSYETAKLLKRSGFDCDEISCINVFKGHTYKVQDTVVDADEDVTIPTIQMAKKWLRETHNKSIEIRSQGLKVTSVGWIVEIYNLVTQDEEFHHPYTFTTYEEACEAAIKYCLENLI